MKRNIGRGGKKAIKLTMSERARRLKDLQDSVFLAGRAAATRWAETLEAKARFETTPTKRYFTKWKKLLHLHSRACRVLKKMERKLDAAAKGYTRDAT